MDSAAYLPLCHGVTGVSLLCVKVLRPMVASPWLRAVCGGIDLGLITHGTGDEKRQAPSPRPSQGTRSCVTLTHKGRLLMTFRAPGGPRCILTIKHDRASLWKKLMACHSSTQNKQHGCSHQRHLPWMPAQCFSW